MAALGLVGVAMAATGVGLLSDPRHRPAAVAAADSPSAPGSSPHAACPPATAVPTEAGTTVLHADLLGVGCPQVLEWRAPLLTVHLPAGGARRYALGRVGDQLAVGSFDCSARPVLVRYRPSTGTLVDYPVLQPGLDPGGWIEPEAPRTVTPGGVLRVRAVRPGCDSVEVVAPG